MDPCRAARQPEAERGIEPRESEAEGRREEFRCRRKGTELILVVCPRTPPTPDSLWKSNHITPLLKIL